MMLRSRHVLYCLLLIIFCQCVEVEVDQLHSSNSPLPIEDTSITEDSKSQIHLNRRKRNVNQQTAYDIDIEVSIPNNGLSMETLQMLLNNVTYPFGIYVGNDIVNITSITPTTGSMKFALRVKNLIFSKDLKNSSSPLYKNISREFNALLNEAYKSVRPDASVKILGFTNGSIIVVHEVFSRSPLSPGDIASSQNEVTNALSNKYITEFLPEDEIPCSSSIFGTTNFNSIAEIPCMGVGGVKKAKCGKNGKYEKELDFCLLPAISNLLELTNSSAEVAKNFSSLLQELSTASQNENITTPGNVQAVVTILKIFSETNTTVNETDLGNFLQIVSSVISTNSIETWRILSSTTPETNPSSQLLQSVEIFSSRLNLTKGTLEIKQTNLKLSATKIISPKNLSPINVTFDNFTIEGYNNLSANLFISADELENAENSVVVTIAYPTWIDILPNNTNFGENFLINGLVVTITLSTKKSIEIDMTFSPRDPTLDFNTAKCAFWNFTGNGIWNDRGCTPILDGENIICKCVHLTSFSILMSSKEEENKVLDYITQIGVAVSLGSLLITIIIEAVVWKHVTKNKTSHTRHVAILNIAINLLIADVWFIVASSIKPESGACVAATFFIHVFYLALFFWMFTLGILLVYHLFFLFHGLSKSALMGISFGIGYLCPVIISVITIGVTYPQDSYIRKGACWLGWRDKYPILAFILPALVIIASNIIVLVMVIFKVLRPTIGDRPRGHNEEKETFKQIVRSVVVLTPILGLTWAFGIPTFQENSHIAFHYIFTILNAFQGFFILVFGTCLDKKVREALLKKFSLTGFSSRTKSAQSTSTGKFPSKHGRAFPGKKKDYKISNQLHSGSKDKSLSYSTLN
ncbi:adhesion G protein-coupled receptor F5-like isoform X2 [Pristis pectinata]|uniref:adhesion G protein-coupled receptor F5-like isoform X2 n=1 Tax=Pristis pectinata TaxID=685728 RepID=UPI00223DE720|nr:adhesion G protein-coupled receptor F5-like isoform X2 [Pristis pectinata]